MEIHAFRQHFEILCCCYSSMSVLSVESSTVNIHIIPIKEGKKQHKKSKKEERKFESNNRASREKK